MPPCTLSSGPHAQKSCCQQHKREKGHYAKFDVQDCYTLATVATRSFGCSGNEARGVVRQMTVAYADRNFTGKNDGACLKPHVKPFIHASFSTVLQMSVSERVRHCLAARVKDTLAVAD